MKNSWNIFKNDGKNVGTNWVAAILIGGLILLPSLYAWLNIKAAWDPYGQTDQIPIGVVDEDVGSNVRDEDINVGDELVDTLKDNDSMDWQFTDRDTAMENLEYGDYFAVIIIPENFSENLSTVASGQPEKANVEYYVNEKLNAIAPKMTDQGASVIVDQVSSNFIATVNGVIFDLFNNIGIELENDLPDIENFENYIFETEEQLPQVHELLNDTLTDATNAEDVIDRAQGLIPEVERVTDEGLGTIDETTSFLTDAEDRLNEMAPQIEEDLERVQGIATNTNNFIQDIQLTEFDFSNGEQLTDQINTDVNEAIQTIETVEDGLQQLQEQNNQEPLNEDNESNDEDESNEDNESNGKDDSNEDNELNEERIDQALEQLADLKTQLENVQAQSESVDAFIDEKRDEVETVVGDLQERAEETSENIDAFVKEYKETIEPTVMEEVAQAKTTLADARGILVEIQDTIPEVEGILDSTDDNLAEGKGTLESVLGEYPYVYSKVTELADRIRNLQDETDINEIIQLLQNDPEAESGFFEEPVELSENKVFPVTNYGTGMTPFYTILAIWVGGLLLISLLATEPHDAETFTMRENYFGRLMTFAGIGLLQTLVVTSGDIFLLGVEFAHPGWFIVFGLFISLVFMSIIYTVVSVFGDVGKAMAIVLLVLQIAGSGGTYPVILLPEFFQMISPFLPFTYAVDLMREALGGIIWTKVAYDLAVLSMFGIGFILIGAFLKKPINKQTKKLVEKSKETGLFH
ncbi:YhgE/Pip domain-containing protein [Virgibacillus sp. NKC19-3]|uniref:YhgE/Pip domain-containing protein n=1 Tax=Virgibacillus saliphilus TaxID=2831674 RepID=UPI001C9AE794|nr:YhgE/Pip domain-containing protein [Virgibacillus sp. NKC19-3]MBY7145031.1 YhgE/Pip domain-containing protein [Virgibacillus sp. NKC19-3]